MKNNQILSEKRANAVRELLIAKGVPAKRLSSSGAGETIPMTENATAEGRSYNRRIEADLIRGN